MGDLPLYERTRELEELTALMANAREGAGQLAVVEGPAGIGKTRLLTEARVGAQKADMRVLAARGLELEREFAYGVVRGLFEPVLNRASEDERAELLTGVTEQAAALLGHADPAPSRWEDGSFAILHGLFWLTANLCAQSPLLVVVDDLHWCDTPSLRFLIHLLPRLDGLQLLVVVAQRPAEPAADQHLLAQITTDPLATVLRPAPLSQTGSARLVRALLTEDAEDEFCSACYAATGGNPLLLRELISVATAEGVNANAAGATWLAELGPQAVGQRMALRLARLGPLDAALCRAVAILGEGADPATAAALAGMEFGRALDVARRLVALDILRFGERSSQQTSCLFEGTLEFVHPLVQAAVYGELSQSDRLAGHVHAARLLAEHGAAAEKVAAHLLRLPPAGDPTTVRTLRSAADEAFLRGSPETAVAYLERCIKEPPAPAERMEILVQLGAVAQLVNMAKAAKYLGAALPLHQKPDRKATIAEMLGRALLFTGRTDEALRVLSQAVESFADEHADLRRRLEAGLITVVMADHALGPPTAEHLSRLRDAPLDAGIGSRMLDATIALQDTLTGAPAETAIDRARRALADGVMIEQINGSEAFFCACLVLMAADLDEVMSILDASLAQAHQHGSVLAFATAKGLRALAWLWRGFPAEAEVDAREAVRAITTAGLELGRPLIGAMLADALMEQGRLPEAAAVLEWATPTTQTGYHAEPMYWFFESHARLLMLQNRSDEGLQALLACGDRFADWTNPAILDWRSRAALALLAAGRREEARPLAAQELDLARRWGAPRALGRALWVSGLVAGDAADGLALLEEAVRVLAPSPARLEHAKALIEFGAAVRRSGHPAQSRQYLRDGVDQAQTCGATPLVARGQTELRAAGGRPRRSALSGPAALTPSERRVADLAAAGYSNRDIAHALFITTKTVEVHLTRAYRKLRVTGRAGLARALASTSASS